MGLTRPLQRAVGASTLTQVCDQNILVALCMLGKPGAPFLIEQPGVCVQDALSIATQALTRQGLLGSIGLPHVNVHHKALAHVLTS